MQLHRKRRRHGYYGVREHPSRAPEPTTWSYSNTAGSLSYKETFPIKFNQFHGSSEVLLLTEKAGDQMSSASGIWGGEIIVTNPLLGNLYQCLRARHGGPLATDPAGRKRPSIQRAA